MEQPAEASDNRTDNPRIGGYSSGSPLDMNIRRTVVVATISAVIVILGVQGVAPIMPSVRDEFGLDSSSISAFTFAYVLGGTIFGFPATALADRFGIRRILIISLVAFGFLGIGGSFVQDFWLLLLFRVVQGAVFGAVIALTIVLTAVEGRALDTAKLLRLRTVAMASGEAVLPVAVGFIAGIFGWRVGFSMQGLALVAALLCWKFVPADVVKRTQSSGQSMLSAVRTLKTPFGAAAQLPAVTRFVVKFSILTYVPILAADVLGMGVAETGLLIGAGALVAVGAAALAPTVLGRWGVVTAISVGLILAAAPLLCMPLIDSPWSLALILVVSGMGDGLLGVYLNVCAIAAAPHDARSAYLGLSGSIRNTSKVLAPSLLGLLVIFMPVGGAIAIVGVLGLLPVMGVRVISDGIRRTQEG